MTKCDVYIRHSNGGKYNLAVNKARLPVFYCLSTTSYANFLSEHGWANNTVKTNEHSGQDR